MRVGIYNGKPQYWKVWIMHRAQPNNNASKLHTLAMPTQRTYTRSRDATRSTTKNAELNVRMNTKVWVPITSIGGSAAVVGVCVMRRELTMSWAARFRVLVACVWLCRAWATGSKCRRQCAFLLLCVWVLCAACAASVRVAVRRELTVWAARFRVLVACVWVSGAWATGCKCRRQCAFLLLCVWVLCAACAASVRVAVRRELTVWAALFFLQVIVLASTHLFHHLMDGVATAEICPPLQSFGCSMD